MSRNKKGFTLIELLIVIGIIGLIAGAILVAVDPVKRIQDARNAKRWSEVNGILNAILTKQVDDKEEYAGEANAPIIESDTLSQVIVSVNPTATIDCDTPATAPLCPGQTLSVAAGAPALACVANLSGVVGTWTAELPIDPIGDGEFPAGQTALTMIALGTDNTGYYIHKTSNGRIEIGSCWPDQSATIKVKR